MDLLNSNRGALDADIRRYYAADLPDVRSGQISVWRLAAWAEHLPLDSASVRASEKHNWSRDHYLLAHMVDALNVANWQRQNMYQPRHKQGPLPEPVERPGYETDEMRYNKAKAATITTAKLLDFKRRTGGE